MIALEILSNLIVLTCCTHNLEHETDTKHQTVKSLTFIQTVKCLAYFNCYLVSAPFVNQKEKDVNFWSNKDYGLWIQEGKQLPNSTNNERQQYKNAQAYHVNPVQEALKINQVQ